MRRTSTATLKGTVILGSLAYSQDQDWKVAGIEARTGEVLWQVDAPENTVALLSDGVADSCACAVMQTRAPVTGFA